MSSSRHHSRAHDTQRSSAEGAAAAESQRIEWSRATILGFIEDYRQQRVLWDPNTKGYHIKQTKYEALKELGRKYGAEIRSIRSKIKSLRSSFHREHGKVISGRRKGVHYQPMWFAYEAIRFILDGEQQQQQQRALTAKVTAAERRAAAGRGAEAAVLLTKLERQERKLAERQLNLVLAHAATKAHANTTEAMAKAEAEAAGDNESTDVDVEEKLAAAAAEHNAELSLAAEERQRAALICGSRSVADLASLCGGFLGASRSAMTEALLLTLEQELKVEAQHSVTSAASTSSCASSVASTAASPMLCANKATTMDATTTAATNNGETLDTAADLMRSSSSDHMTAAEATYAAAANLALADSNNNHTNSNNYSASGNNNNNSNIVARVAAAVAAMAAGSNSSAATATTTTSASGLLQTRSADELTATVSSGVGIGGLGSGNCVSRNDFDSDSQTYCNIRAEDVKTELIESDSAELAMMERPPPVTSIPPYMYYKLQEPITSSRKRKSQTPQQHCRNDEAPSPSKQQYQQQQQQQHSNLNNNNNSSSCLNRQHDLSSNTATLLTNGVNCSNSSSSSNNSASSTATVAGATAQPHNAKTLSSATDEYGVFGEYVAITIRHLKTSKSKIVVKHLINNLLYEAELGKYDHGMPASKEPPQLYKL